MARWYLTAPHYLKLKDPEKWEYSETSRATGRPRRVQFPVGTYLDPNDESQCQEKPSEWREQGRLWVSDGKDSKPGDIIFVGDPTPDMVPDPDNLSDESHLITAAFKVKKWKDFNPSDALQSFSQSMIDGHLQAQAEVVSKPDNGMKELAESIQAMAQQNAELLKHLTSGIRR